MARQFGGARSTYRKAFVGRARELSELRAALDAALHGTSGVMMLAGEPGIGKTALCRQLDAYILSENGAVLRGHCYAEYYQPYQPFVEALGAYIRSADPETLREAAGAGNAGVGRILPELSERLGLDLSTPWQAENDQWRLLNAVTDFLIGISQKQPVLLVLEDLHWADQGTLELLKYLARRLEVDRVLIVGTFREQEVDARHPLSPVLVELRRLMNYRRLSLTGLSVEEVRSLYEIVRGDSVPVRQAELVQRLTEGNPLFVEEVLQFLIEEGLVVQEGGRFQRTDDRPLENVVPASLREVISRRIALDDSTTYEVLTVAAVMGREFRLDVLADVSGVGETEMWKALEGAAKRGIVEDTGRMNPVVFRFSHALFREVLYEAVFTPRRSQLHHLIGQALEAAAHGSPADLAAELVEHFSRGPGQQDLLKTIEYGELAAEQALRSFSYREAAGYLEQALRAVAACEPPDMERKCELLLLLGTSLVAAGEPRRYLDEVAPKVVSLAESVGRKDIASRAAQQAILALLASRGAGGWNELEAMFWAEEAWRLAPAGSTEEAWAESALGRAITTVGRLREGHAHANKALTLARAIDDNPTYWFVGMMWLWTVQGWEHAIERLNLAMDLRGRSRLGVSPLILRSAVNVMVQAFLEMGQRDALDEAVHEIHQEAKRTRQPNFEILSLVYGALDHYWSGTLPKAVTAYEKVEAAASELGLETFALNAWPQGFSEVLILLGRWHPLVEKLPRINAYPVIRLLLSGDIEGARKLLDEDSVVESGGITSERVGTQMQFLEVALLVGNRRIVSNILEDFADAPVLFGSAAWGACIPRLQGDACMLLEQPWRARGYYECAVNACVEMRFAPELTLSKLGLAEAIAAIEPDEREQVQSLLDEVLTEAQSMSMEPALKRAHALQARLAYTSGRRSANSDRLSDRETEVLRLLAAGRSNQQIADELVLSVRTVERHVANVYAKTGTHTRSQATAYAIGHGIITV